MNCSTGIAPIVAQEASIPAGIEHIFVFDVRSEFVLETDNECTGFFFLLFFGYVAFFCVFKNRVLHTHPLSSPLILKAGGREETQLGVLSLCKSV